MNGHHQRALAHRELGKQRGDQVAAIIQHFRIAPEGGGAQLPQGHRWPARCLARTGPCAHRSPARAEPCAAPVPRALRGTGAPRAPEAWLPAAAAAPLSQGCKRRDDFLRAAIRDDDPAFQQRFAAAGKRVCVRCDGAPPGLHRRLEPFPLQPVSQHRLAQRRECQPSGFPVGIVMGATPRTHREHAQPFEFENLCPGLIGLRIVAGKRRQLLFGGEGHVTLADVAGLPVEAVQHRMQHREYVHLLRQPYRLLDAVHHGSTSLMNSSSACCKRCGGAAPTIPRCAPDCIPCDRPALASAIGRAARSAPSRIRNRC